MVALTTVHESNALIRSTLPPGLVGVFVGATSGIGEATFKEFVKETVKPRCYFIGRSQTAADRIIKECKDLNDGADVTFIQADLTLIKSADDVCEQIKKRETSINVLVVSSGAVLLDWPITSENLPAMPVLVLHSRFRIMQQLLPLLRNAKHLSRVVSIAGGTKEGKIYPDDLSGFKIPFRLFRGHVVSLITLSMEALAARAPEVAFINTYPGMVKTALWEAPNGIVGIIANFLISVLSKFIGVPIDESGARNLFLATSARFPGASKSADGVPLVAKLQTSRGVDGNSGSGVYSINWDGESAPQSVETLLKGYRDEGLVDVVWQHLNDAFTRIEKTY